MTKSECRMTNGGRLGAFQARFGSLENAGGGTHDAFSIVVSVAFLAIEPSTFRRQFFVG